MDFRPVVQASLLTVAMVILACFGCPEAQAQGIAGKVIAVHSGPALTLHGAMGRRYQVRLADVITPDAGQPFAAEANQLVGELCLKAQGAVKLSSSRTRERNAGRVWCNGVDLALELVRRGYGRRSKPDDVDVELGIAEFEAKAQGLGIWSLSTQR